MGVSLGTAGMVDNIGTTCQSVKITVVQVTVQVIAKGVGNGRGGGERKGGPVLLRECVFGPDLRHSRRRTGPPCLSALARLITPLHPFFLHLSIHPHVIVCVPWAQFDIEAVVLVGLGISNRTPRANKTFLQGGPVLLRECVFGPDLRHSRRRTGPPCLSALCNSLHIIVFPTSPPPAPPTPTTPTHPTPTPKLNTASPACLVC